MGYQNGPPNWRAATWGNRAADIHQRLTAVRIRGLKEPDWYADGNALHLVVEPSGAKRWMLRVVSGGKRCDLGLGSLSTVGLADARVEAARLRGLARKGVDVVAERAV